MSDPQAPPPGPGWWLASDGRWYPPQQATQPPPPMQPTQPPRKSGNGCLIALAVVVLLGMLIVAGIAVALWKFASTVDDVVDGVTIGDVECPTEEKVSDLVGDRVDLAMSGSIVVASGCSYTSAGDGPGVTIVSGSGLVSDEVLAELESEAARNGAEVTSIEVGDDGRAFGSPTRSAAATKDGGHIVEVDIFSQGTEPIGDKRDEAVELLEMYLDLND